MGSNPAAEAIRDDQLCFGKHENHSHHLSCQGVLGLLVTLVLILLRFIPLVNQPQFSALDASDLCNVQVTRGIIMEIREAGGWQKVSFM